MAFERLTGSLQEVIERIEDYGSSTAEYFKLRLFKSAMKFSTALVNMLVLGFISFLFLIFISIGGALYLSSQIGNPFSGFLIVGSVYLLILLLVIFFGKGFIEQKMLLKFSDLLIEEDEYDPKKMAEENLKEEKFEESLDGRLNDNPEFRLENKLAAEESLLTPINEKSNL